MANLAADAAARPTGPPVALVAAAKLRGADLVTHRFALEDITRRSASCGSATTTR